MDRQVKRRRGRRARKSHQQQGVAPETLTLARVPLRLPDVPQVSTATRWLRVHVARPASPANFSFTVNILHLAAFGGDCIPGSYLYIKKLRIWTETSEQSMTVDVVARPYVVVLTDSIPATRFSAVSTVGQEQACVSVTLPEVWRITPFVLADASLLFIVRSDTPPNITLDALITTVQRGPSNQLVTGGSTPEALGFEQLTL